MSWLVTNLPSGGTPVTLAELVAAFDATFAAATRVCDVLVGAAPVAIHDDSAANALARLDCRVDALATMGTFFPGLTPMAGGFT